MKRSGQAYIKKENDKKLKPALEGDEEDENEIVEYDINKTAGNHYFVTMIFCFLSKLTENGGAIFLEGASSKATAWRRAKIDWACFPMSVGDFLLKVVNENRKLKPTLFGEKECSIAAGTKVFISKHHSAVRSAYTAEVIDLIANDSVLKYSNKSEVYVLIVDAPAKQKLSSSSIPDIVNCNADTSPARRAVEQGYDSGDSDEVVFLGPTISVKCLFYAFEVTNEKGEKIIAAKSGSFTTTNVTTISLSIATSTFPVSLKTLKELLLSACTSGATKIPFEPQTMNLYVSESLQFIPVVQSKKIEGQIVTKILKFHEADRLLADDDKDFVTAPIDGEKPIVFILVTKILETTQPTHSGVTYHDWATLRKLGENQLTKTLVAVVNNKKENDNFPEAGPRKDFVVKFLANTPVSETRNITTRRVESVTSKMFAFIDLKEPVDRVALSANSNQKVQDMLLHQFSQLSEIMVREWYTLNVEEHTAAILLNGGKRAPFPSSSIAVSPSPAAPFTQLVVAAPAATPVSLRTTRWETIDTPVTVEAIGDDGNRKFLDLRYVPDAELSNCTFLLTESVTINVIDAQSVFPIGAKFIVVSVRPSSNKFNGRFADAADQSAIVIVEISKFELKIPLSQ